MRCRECRLYFETLPHSVTLGAPTTLPAAQCRKCQTAYSHWRQSRQLLQSLSEAATPPPEAPDAAAQFWRRLQPRLLTPPAPAWRSWLQIPVATRELLMAGIAMLLLGGVFTYNIRRLQNPGVAEAMGLDVPHVHASHPYLDHQHRPEDVLLSIMTK
jgi:hypothetical protein